MNLGIALRDGATLGAVVALLAGLGEVLGTIAGLLPAYQRGVTLGLSAYAIPLYGIIGLTGGAALGAVLWIAGVRSHMRPILVVHQGVGWFLALGAIILNESLRYQPTPTARLVILNGGLAVAGIGVGALLWGLERMCTRWRLRWLSLVPVVAVALSVAGLLSGTWLDGLSRSTGSTPPQTPAEPNVILIVMDTTRADHLSAYGYGRPTSPTIDRLAAEGARFETAMVPSSWTLPSVASLMTGLLPSAHGADHGYWFLDDDRLTLAEILRERGYATGGFVGGPFCKATFGLAQGFDTYDDALTPLVMNLALVRATAKLLNLEALTRHERRADQINDVILPWLQRNADRPFFLFINYFDPHDPYQPPNAYARRWASPDGLDGDIDRSGLIPRVVKGLAPPLTPTERSQLLGLYDGEIAFMDAQIGRLVETLARLGVLDRSILILTADHGESFGEHQLMTHGNALYEEQVRVPLIVRFPPRIRAGMVVPTPVHTLDILPTVLELLNTPPAATLPGRSLLPLLTSGRPRGERTLVAELRRGETWSRLSPRFNRDLVALRQGKWKYIASSSGTAELYNLHQDPAELDNRVQGEPELVGRFHREALRWMTRLDERGPRRAIDQSTREQLKALGY